MKIHAPQLMINIQNEISVNCYVKYFNAFQTLTFIVSGYQQQYAVKKFIKYVTPI